MPEEQRTPLPPAPIRDDLDDGNPVERSIKAALRREHAALVGMVTRANRDVAIGRALQRELEPDTWLTDEQRARRTPQRSR
tara:strand:- start:794 stop:1036 length:243 start_codon:yes stop_codon:yes gene_type:complete